MKKTKKGKPASRKQCPIIQASFKLYFFGYITTFMSRNNDIVVTRLKILKRIQFRASSRGFYMKYPGVKRMFFSNTDESSEGVFQSEAPQYILHKDVCSAIIDIAYSRLTLEKEGGEIMPAKANVRIDKVEFYFCPQKNLVQVYFTIKNP